MVRLKVIVPVCIIAVSIAVMLKRGEPVPCPIVQERAPRARPCRAEPSTFPPGTHLPRCRETLASGPIDLDVFDPQVHLVHVADEQIWWESDHQSSGDEDDHLMHAAMEGPLRLLARRVQELGGSLKVHDAYRPTGVHCATSLHKEGRAIDLTCDGISLARLARLCWSVGFDWVYYEAGAGSHVHCSLKPMSE